MIRVEKVRFRYGGAGSDILKGVSLTIGDGEYVGIVGSNGSGKSTLAKHFNALLLPSSGRVFVDGLDTWEIENVPRVRQSVGMVFQNPDNQIVGTIVEDDVAFGPENLGLPRSQIRERVEFALSVTGLSSYRHFSPANLSGGQKQRLAIAGIVAMRPRHIVFDEPTSMLDPAGREEVVSLILQLRAEYGIAVVHITHRLDELLHADRVVALEKGEIIFDGPSPEFFGSRRLLERLELQPPPAVEFDSFLRRAFSVAVEFESLRDVDALACAAASRLAPRRDDARRHGGGARRAVSPAASRTPPDGTDAAGGSPYMAVEGLFVTYAEDTPFEVTALRDVSFELVRGGTTGIVGATGSGKSTLVQAMMRLVEPTAGEIRYPEGFDTARLYRHIGMVFQQPEDQLFEKTVWDDIAFGPRRLGCGEQEVRRRVGAAMESVGLDEASFADKVPFELSGGEKRRVAIAGILALEPEVLIMDEPTAGLDHRGCRRLMDTLTALRRARGLTLMVITHDMEMLVELADGLLVLEEGRLRCHGRTREVFSRDEVFDVSGLELPFAARLHKALAARGVLPPSECVCLSMDELQKTLERECAPAVSSR